MAETTQSLPLSLIVESANNPRKTFSEASLAELAESIRATGLLQPIVVRPHPRSTGWEIVFGHRRFRAAALAGLDEIDAIVRDMSDEDADRARLHENLEREDVHYIEEAEAMARLVADHGCTIESLAKDTGKGDTYVRLRLKLAQLHPVVRKTLLEHPHIGVEIAGQIARRPQSLQCAALDAVTYRIDGELRVQSYRQAVDILRTRFTVPIESAPWAGDAVMHACCQACPKLSNNDPLHADVPAGLCTDQSCFKGKVAEWESAQVSKLREAGRVIEGEAAQAFDTGERRLYTEHSTVMSPSGTGAIPLKVLLKQATKAGLDLPLTAVISPEDGTITTGVTEEDLTALREQLRPAGSTGQPAAGPMKHGFMPNPLEALPLDQQALLRGTCWSAVREALRDRILSTPRSTDDLRYILAMTIDNSGSLRNETLQALGVPDEYSDEDVMRCIPAASADMLGRAVLIDALYDDCGSYFHSPDAIATALARRRLLTTHYGVDPVAAAGLSPAPDASSTPTADLFAGTTHPQGEGGDADVREAGPKGEMGDEEEQKDEAACGGEQQMDEASASAGQAASSDVVSPVLTPQQAWPFPKRKEIPA